MTYTAALWCVLRTGELLSVVHVNVAYRGKCTRAHPLSLAVQMWNYLAATPLLPLIAALVAI